MDDTLTGKFEDLILENFSRDQLLKTSKYPNTTSSLVGDPNFVELVDPVQVKSLLDKSVISQIETFDVEYTSPIGSNRSMANGRKISPKKGHWALQSHLKKSLLSATQLTQRKTKKSH